MACLRSAESVREFVSAVTSTEAAAGIYTLIRNSVHRYIDCYTDQCRSQCACFAFARRACWPCQQDSCNTIKKTLKQHLLNHFIGAPCDPSNWFPRVTPVSATKLVSPCEIATKLVPRVRQMKQRATIQFVSEEDKSACPNQIRARRRNSALRYSS